MRQIIGGKVYDTAKATLLASDRYWDGHNFERSGRNTHLYRTEKGAYFFERTSMWQGEARVSLVPCDVEDAVDFYEAMQPHDTTEVPFKVAFPEVGVLEA